MRQVNVHEAKTHFSRLLDDVAHGDEVVIARSGVPVARLVPIAQQDELGPRPMGFLKGQIWMSEDFDDPLPDELWRAPVFPAEGS
jgi:prevent-host-death family protein